MQAAGGASVRLIVTVTNDDYYATRMAIPRLDGVRSAEIAETGGESRSADGP